MMNHLRTDLPLRLHRAALNVEDEGLTTAARLMREAAVELEAMQTIARAYMSERNRDEQPTEQQQQQSRYARWRQHNFEYRYKFSSFLSPGCWDREWLTCLEYLAIYCPHLLELMDAEDPVDTQRDGFWLMHRCREYGIGTAHVEAPPVLKSANIQEVRVYPKWLLERRYG